MRCFIAASDDELYAYIERYGIGALVPYRVGMPTVSTTEAPVAPTPAVVAATAEIEAPRLAA